MRTGRSSRGPARRLLALGWACILPLAAAGPVFAQTAQKPTRETPPPAAAKSSSPPTLAFERVENNGFCRMPGWLRYTVSIRTFGEAFKGRVRIQLGGDFGVGAALPAASVKTFTIPVLIESPGGAFQASLTDEAGRDTEIAVALPPPVRLKPGDVLTGLVADERRTDWTDPSLFLPNAKTVFLLPRDLPTTASDLEAFDLIVFHANLPANPEVRDALIGWVESGGVLFLPTPRLFEGTDRGAALDWLSPGFRQERPVPPDALLQKWKVLDHHTAFLETLGVPRAVESPLGGGWIAMVERGSGMIAFCTRPFASPKSDPKTEEAVRAFWSTLCGSVAGFEDRSPPNPKRPSERVAVVEPKLYRFFKAAQWPGDVLRLAKIGVVIYAGLVAVVLTVSLVFFYRSWQHFSLALGVCLVGSGVLWLGFSPSRTAVGETLGLVQAQTGQTAPTLSRMFHVASFTRSRVNCSLAAQPGERVYQVAYSQEDRHSQHVRWNFGDRVEIEGIRLEEGGRFLALATGRPEGFGTLSARWESPGTVVIKTEVRHALSHCALIRNGLFLPLEGFKFGDAPRPVDLDGEWIALARFLEKMSARNSLAEPQSRAVRALFDEYYAPGEILFFGFFVQKNPDFQSRDLLIRDTGLHLFYWKLPPAPSAGKSE